MPANKYNGYTNLGVGVGLRVPHYRCILEDNPKIDWFEIISENFMVDGGRPLSVLDEILDRYPVVQHGVSMYFGSPKELNKEHLVKLKKLTERTRTPFLTDHLCWGSVNGYYTHDLLPLPFTKEAVKRAAENIKSARDFLEIPICVENISSYAEFNSSEMTEWQFLSEVVESADCGILLDVNNIYVSAQNHGFNPDHYIEGIPIERVGQIHIAGHTVNSDCILDTHDRPVSDDVWTLYSKVLTKTGPINTLLEWDSNLPSFEALQAEALKSLRFETEVLQSA